MAIGFTGFSKVWSPFATVICFGMLFATTFTLLVIRTGYLIVEDAKAWTRRRLGRETAENAALAREPSAG